VQLDLVRSGRPGPVTGGAASRNPGPATPAQCVAAQIAQADGTRQYRPRGANRPLSPGTQGAGGIENHYSGNGDPLASRWFSSLLAPYPLSGRPKISAEIRQLVREMSLANPFWGAPRIHGELLKLGIAVGQTTVAKYMVRRRRPPSQGWKTFLRNHTDAIASIDMFVVPTVSFQLLYGLVILRHSRRKL